MCLAVILLHTTKSGQRLHLLEPASSARPIASAVLVVNLAEDVWIAKAYARILQDKAPLLELRLAVMFTHQWKTSMVTAISCF
jgi:hypothetical protein